MKYKLQEACRSRGSSSLASDPHLLRPNHLLLRLLLLLPLYRRVFLQQSHQFPIPSDRILKTHLNRTKVMENESENRPDTSNDSKKAKERQMEGLRLPHYQEE